MVLFSRLSFILFIMIITSMAILTIPSDLRLGMIYFNSYKYEEAFRYLNDVQSTDTTNVKALKKIKDYFLINGKTEDALKVQKKLVDLKPKNIGYRLELEKLYDWTLRPYKKIQAMELRAELLNEKEKDLLLYNVANGYRWLRDYKSANRVYNQIARKFLDRPSYYQEILNYFLATKQIEKTIQLLEPYVARHKDNLEVTSQLATAYQVAGREDLAARSYLKLLGKKASFAQYYGKTGWLKELPKKRIVENLNYIEFLIYHYESKGMKDLSLGLKKELIEIFPDKASIRFSVAESLFKAKSFKEAFVLYKSLENVKTSREYYLYEVSLRYSDMKKQNDQIRALEKLIKIAPKVPIYLESLAELYEEKGEKRKALKLYYRILILEKNKLKILWRKSFENFEKLAFKSEVEKLNNKIKTDASSGLKLKIKPKVKLELKKKRQRTRIKRIQLKIVELLDELNEPQKAIAGYKELLADDPYNKDLIRGLAFVYYKAGQELKAQNQFKKLYDLGERDTETLEIYGGRLLSLKEYLKAKAVLALGMEKEKNFRPYLYSLYEESLFQTEKEQHAEFCEKVIGKQYKETEELLNLEYRCLFRLKEYDLAIVKANKLIKLKPKNLDYSVQLIYACLEAKNYSCAKRKVSEMKKTNAINRFNKEEQVYFQNIFNEVERKRAFVLRHKQTFYDADGFSYWSPEFLIGKRHNNLLFGADVKFWKTSGSSSVEFSLPSFLIQYESDSWLVNSHLGVVQGDKKQELSTELNFQKFYPELFFSISLKGKKPEVGSALLANETTSKKSSLEIFSEKKWQDLNTLSVFLFLDKFYFRDDMGSGKGLSLEYMRKIKKESLWSYGAKTFISSSSGDPLIEAAYLSKTLSYYGLISFKKSFKRKESNSHLIYSKFGIGGDLERDFGPGKLIDFNLSYQYDYGIFKNFKLGFNHLRESSTVGNASVNVYQLLWNHWL